MVLQEKRKLQLISSVVSKIIVSNAESITNQKKLKQKFMKKYLIHNHQKLLKLNGVIMNVSAETFGNLNLPKFQTTVCLEKICNPRLHFFASTTDYLLEKLLMQLKDNIKLQ